MRSWVGGIRADVMGQPRRSDAPSCNPLYSVLAQHEAIHAVHAEGQSPKSVKLPERSGITARSSSPLPRTSSFVVAPKSQETVGRPWAARRELRRILTESFSKCERKIIGGKTRGGARPEHANKLYSVAAPGGICAPIAAARLRRRYPKDSGI
jgi:hypothetical protein